jgi:hypothetical protein
MDEEDLEVKLKSFIAERELICRDIFNHQIAPTEAGEKLV